MAALLNSELQRFQMAPVFSEAEAAHTLLPVPDVVATYVVEDDSAPHTFLSPARARAHATPARPPTR